mmetsp:Transcript_50074/g.140406  ORF Transcript_50074/g.140406 Transcript_50074/m.140406 type:complete len:280 (+) Transcript_50074:120-959(+)
MADQEKLLGRRARHFRHNVANFRKIARLQGLPARGFKLRRSGRCWHIKAPALPRAGGAGAAPQGSKASGSAGRFENPGDDASQGRRPNAAQHVMTIAGISHRLDLFLGPRAYARMRSAAVAVRDAYLLEGMYHACRSVWCPAITAQKLGVRFDARSLRIACRAASCPRRSGHKPLRGVACEAREFVFMLLHGFEPRITFTARDLAGVRSPLDSLARTGQIGLLRLLRERASDSHNHRWAALYRKARRNANRGSRRHPSDKQASRKRLAERHIVFESDSE